ncbi:MAG: DUF4185 domain-containing protein [Mycobacteriales bacterium]
MTIDSALERLFYSYGNASPGNRWTGSDGAYSVRLPDGRDLWLWGDTFLGTVNADGSRDPQGFIHNAWTVQNANGSLGATLYTSSPVLGPKAWINPADPATWYWLGDAVVQGDTLYQFLWHIGGAGGEFDVLDAEIATFSLPGLTLEKITASPGTYLPSTQAGGSVLYGVSVVSTGGYDYVYGCEDGLFGLKYLHVARVADGQLTNPTAWQYWSGSSWSSVEADSVRVLDNGADEMSVVRTRSGYRAVIQNETNGPEIYAYSSPSPEGPWGDRMLLYRTPTVGGTLITYNAKEHPELDRPTHIVISYDVNVTSADPNGLYSNVDNFRPRFIDVYIPPATR